MTLDATDPRRRERPLEGPGPYRVVDSRVCTVACELNVVDHCNMACSGCSHLSPLLGRHIVDAEAVERDLGTLSAAYWASHVRLIGGEPLLHPHLDELAAAVRRSGVTDRIRLVTNGTRLPRAAESIWASVDEIHISEYPGAGLSDADAAIVAARAAEHRVSVTVKAFHHFRQPFATSPAEDDRLVERVYGTCQMAHVWRCHTVADGHLWRCPQSSYIPQAAVRGELARDSGFLLDTGPDLLVRLLAFLETASPLTACRYCLGSIGRLFDHHQTPRSSWLSELDGDYQSAVDHAFLASLEADPALHNDCWRDANPVSRLR